MKVRVSNSAILSTLGLWLSCSPTSPTATNVGSDSGKDHDFSELRTDAGDAGDAAEGWDARDGQELDSAIHQTTADAHPDSVEAVVSRPDAAPAATDSATQPDAAPALPGLGIPVQISVGDRSTAVLYSSGAIRLFGYYLNNRVCDAIDSRAQVIQAGAHASSTQEDALPLFGALGIDNGDDNLCIIYADSTTSCCGSNTSQQRGNPNVSGGNERAPVLMSDGQALGGVTDVSVGYGHICAVQAPEGAAWCWGSNFDGQLGAGTNPPDAVTQVLAVGGSGPMVGVRDLSTGGFFTCAVQADTSVACWGATYALQPCGPEGCSDFMAPGLVVREDGSLFDGIRSVEAAFSSTCALAINGEVFCWGDNSRGQLGRGTMIEVGVFPERVVDEGGSPIIAEGISSGPYHTCAVVSVLDDGQVTTEVECWGSNTYGQLGDGTLEDAFSAKRVAGTRGAISVSTGGTTNAGLHACALWGDGTIQCWGANDDGQMNAEQPGAYSPSPVPIIGL